MVTDVHEKLHIVSTCPDGDERQREVGNKRPARQRNTEIGDIQTLAKDKAGGQAQKRN